MAKPASLCYFYELSSSPLMEVDKEEIPYMQNLLQPQEDAEETSRGKRKINSIVETEDEREVKRIAFFSQESPEEEQEDIDMVEEDPEREDYNEMIMKDYVLEEECVVDFDGFF